MITQDNILIPYNPVLENIASQYNIDPIWFRAMVARESGFNPTSVSASGALGLTQIIPKYHRQLIKNTAKLLGHEGEVSDNALLDPSISLHAGARHLAWLLADDKDGQSLSTSERYIRAIRKYHSGSYTPNPGWSDGQGTTSQEHIDWVLRYRTMIINAMGDTQVADKPYILITAGHRSTQDPGNKDEQAITDDLARAAVEHFRAHGFTADWLQRDLDKDGNDTMTVGSLTTVAVLCRNVLQARPEPMSILFDLHFNGYESPVHVIPPSWSTGLGAAFSGNHAVDTLANNTLDHSLGKAVVRQITRRTGQKVLGSDGIMVEKNTGVGLNQKARLGMLSGTVGVRNKAVRMVVECGGINDFKRIQNLPQKVADGLVAAVYEVFKLNGEAEPTTPTTTPAPDRPTTPQPVYPLGMTRETIDKLFGTVTPFNPDGPVSRIWLENGSRTGRFPSLEQVIEEADGSKYYFFSDGSVIGRVTGDAEIKLLVGTDAAPTITYSTPHLDGN